MVSLQNCIETEQKDIAKNKTNNMCGCPYIDTVQIFATFSAFLRVFKHEWDILRNAEL